jgi:hemolysin activation/secretion protein
LIRSRNDNLYALVDFDIRTYQDRVDSTGTLTDKRAWVWTASLYGDHRDRLGGGGENSYSLGWSFGRMDILTPAAQAAVAATSQASGNYQKLAFAAARLQRVTDSVSLYGAVNGQLASKNLDISEKMSLGGAYAVRAYPVGEAYGDQGYVLDLEARLLLPKFSERMPGRVHLVGFVDSGTVTLNKSPWTPGSNSRTLSGIGVGVTWSDYNDFAINAYYARKLGNEVAISAPDSAGRFWIQLVKYF